MKCNNRKQYMVDYKIKYKKELLEKQNYIIRKSKICPKCKIEKPIDDFRINVGEKDKHYSWCKSCCSIRDKAYRKLHKINPTIITIYHWLFLNLPYDMKQCIKCGKIKPIEDFYLRDNTGNKKK